MVTMTTVIVTTTTTMPMMMMVASAFRRWVVVGGVVFVKADFAYVVLQSPNVNRFWFNVAAATFVRNV